MCNEWDVVHTSRAAPLRQVLVHGVADCVSVPGRWEAHPLTLEELTLAYLREPSALGVAWPSAHSSPRREGARRSDDGGETPAVPPREEVHSRSGSVAADGVGDLATSTGSR